MGEISDRPGNDSGRRTPRGLLVLLVLVVALLASATAGSAMTASPADTATGVSTLAASGGLPKEVKYLCAAKKGGVLRYVTGLKQCTGEESRITISSDRPIAACASDSSGIVRRIPLSGKCRSGEDRMTLPGKEPRRFCAAAGKGRLIYGPNSPCEPEDTPVVVPAANEAPSARAQAVTVDEDGSVGVTLRATDPDGDRLAYSIVNDPDHGEVTGTDTDRTYASDADFNGNDAFVFRVSDGKGGTDTARVGVSVTPVNDAPVAEDDTKFTPENTPLVFPASDLLSNDSKGAPNESAQNLTVMQVSNPQHGAVDLDTKGNGDPSDDEVTFTPETDYKGPASFEYEVCDDGTPQLCSTQTATVSVAVTPVNAKPVATDDARTMDEDDPPITIDLAALVSDVETIDADLTYTITDGPSAAQGELTGSGPSRAFDSADDFNGQVTIDYKAADRGDPDNCGAPGLNCAASQESEVKTVTVTVDPVNDAPVSTADDYEVDEDGTLDVADGPEDVLANDADVDNDPLTAVLVSGPSHDASFTLNPDGSFSYAPNPDYGGDDSFTYKANDGATDGNTVTASIAVKPVNDNPDAKDDAVTTDEDADAVVDVLSNDVIAPDTGETLSVQSVTTPSHGAASKSTTGSDAGKVLYEPEAEFSGSDSFDYTISDGNGGTDTATVNVTVDPVNDAPVVTASGGSASYTEGQTGPHDTIVDPDLTLGDVDDTSLDGAAVEITANFASGDQLVFSDTAGISGNHDPGTGVLTLTGTASVSDYQAALRTVAFKANGDDPGSATRTIRFTADDGAASNNTGSATRAVDVTPVNDAPVNTVPSGPLTAAQDKDTFITGFSVADPDAGSSAVEVTLDVDHGEITLKNDVTGGLTAGNLDGNGSGTVTITGTLAKINATLADPNGLVYHSDAAFTGTDTLTITTDDRGNTGTGGNETDTDTLDLDVKKINDPPVPTDDNRTTAEDTTLTFLASTLAANDSPGVGEGTQTLTVTGVNSTADTHGAVSFTSNDPGAADDQVRYVPDADYNGPASFEYTVKDDGGTDNGGQDTATGTVNVTVTAVNDAPIATADSRTTDEDTDLTITASDLVTSDDEGPVTATDEDAQNLTVTAVGNASGGTVSLSSGQITFDPAADYNGPASFEYTVRDDGKTADSDDFKTDTGQVSVTVTAVNDAPALAAPATFDVDEDVATALTGITASDVDAGSGNVVVTFSVGSGTISAASGGGVTVGGTATQRTLTGTVANVNAFVAGSGVKFTSALNSTDDVTLTVSVNDNGNTGTGGAKTDSETATINVRPVNDAPTADAESFSGAIGNTKIAVGTTVTGEPVVNITGDVLTGDTDIEGDALSITAGSISTTNGGSVQMNSDGTFTYVPNDGFTGNDTFDYQVCDDGESGEPPAADPKCGTGQVTITVTEMVWYVNNNSASGGTGRSTDPFDTLVEAQNASSASQTIFVYRGDGTTTGQNAGISLKNGQRLLGEHVGLTVGNTNLLGANAGNRPAVGNASGNGVSILASTANGPRTGVEVRGFSTSGSTNAVDATSADAANLGVTISENVITGAGSEGIDINQGSTGSATLAIHDNNLTSTGNALDVNRAAGTATITRFDDNAASGDAGASGIVINGPVTFDANPGTSAFDLVSGGDTDVGASGNGVGSSGIVLNSVSGDLSFTDLDVYASNGTGLAASSSADFSATSGTGLRINVSDNAGTFDASGGPALDVNRARLGLSGIGLRSANSPTSGTSLVNTDSSTVSTTSGSSIGGVTSASGTAFRVDGSTGTYTYNGTINATTGKGVELTNNTGGTIAFVGTLTLSTGTNPAFAATGGGTVTATNTANTLASTTGTTLNVANTNIGSSNLVFRSISANGAANGIVLNNTGTSGGLTVTGDGGTCTIATPTCTGGTIQNTTGDGVSLTSTKDVSLSFTRNLNAGGQGVNGASVDGFTLKNSLNIGAGNADEENGLRFGNDDVNVGPITSGLTGTVLIQDVVIDSPIQWGLRLYNSAGNLNMTVRRLTVQNNRNVDNLNLGEDAVSMRVTGGTSNVLVDDSDFLNVDGGVTGQAIGTPGGTLNLTVQNSNWNQVEALPFGINFNSGGQGTGRLKATGNTMVGCTGTVPINRCSVGIDLDASVSSTLDATILNNTISNTGIGSGLEFIVNENAIGRAEVRDNTVNLESTQTDKLGMNFHARNVNVPTPSPYGQQTGTLDLTLEGNIINNVNPSGGAAYGAFNILAGTSDNTINHPNRVTVNLDDGANGAGGNVVNGVNDAPGLVFDFMVRMRTGSTFQLQGYGGSASSASAVAGFINSNNLGGTFGDGTAANDVFVGTGGNNAVNYTSGTAALPSTPTLP